MERPRHIKIIIVIAVVFYGLVIIHISRSVKKENEYIEALQKEYQSPVSVNGIVVSFESLKGVSLVKLDNGNNYMLQFSKNYAYKPPELVSFLETGDSVVKNSSSDTLYIYRDQKGPYIFKLGKYLNDN